MGSIYKRKWKDKDGIEHESETWWIKYYQDGKPIRESTETTKETEAKKALKEKEGDVVKGVPIVPGAARVKFRELADNVVNDYRINAKKSLKDVERRFKKHINPCFGDRRAGSITTANIREFIDARQTAGASNGEINRELAAIKRAFSLAVKEKRLVVKPFIPMLAEAAPRSGFFDAAQLKAVLANLPEPLQPLVQFMFVTGWRSLSEVITLQWRHVDFEAGCIRLDPGTTKNGEGRVFPFTADLKAVLDQQKASVDRLRKESNVICPWVFHRDGQQIRSFRKAFSTACKVAGLPGRIPHDMRRAAARNLVRAGISERVAMQLMGHKTRSIFDRYHIVNEADLIEAAKRLDSMTGTVAGTVAPKAGKRSLRRVR